MSAAEAAAPAKRQPIHGPGRPDKYLNAAGDQVPSVTTITGRFKDSGALLAWAHKQGLQGIPLNEARDKGADAGHIVHQWIQEDLAARPRTGFPFTPDETLDKAITALVAFEEWALRVQLEIVATEVPMVHSVLGYGGTWDAIGFITTALGARELVLLDWKSGKGIYGEHLVQLAAYRELLRDAAEQAGGSLPVPESGVIIRLDKETGTPHPREFDSGALDLGWTYFELIHRGYRLDQAISKMVATPKKKPSKKGKAA